MIGPQTPDSRLFTSDLVLTLHLQKASGALDKNAIASVRKEYLSNRKWRIANRRSLPIRHFHYNVIASQSC